MPIIVANKTETTDGPAHAFLQRVNCDLPLVLISRANDFVFNDELLKLDKYVLIDYCEYNWDWDRKETHIWGSNTAQFHNIFDTDEWVKFDEFVKNNKPYIYFKRELLLKDKSSWLVPIEYPNWQQSFQRKTKEQFDNSPISCFNVWGRSHEDRVRLHGEIWLNAAEKGHAISDNVYYLQKFLEEEQNKNKWVTLNIPHYARQPIETILSINSLSKISISLPGCGVKCFRSTGEAAVNAAMFMQEDELAWSYPWEHGVNCIKSEAGKEIEAIELALKMSNLYEIYLAGMNNADKYRVANYCKNHLEPLINQ